MADTLFSHVRPGVDWDPTREAELERRARGRRREYSVPGLDDPLNPSRIASDAHEKLKWLAERQNQTYDDRNELAHYLLRQAARPTPSTTINNSPQNADKLEWRAETPAANARERISRFLTGKETGEIDRKDAFVALLSLALPGITKGLQKLAVNPQAARAAEVAALGLHDPFEDLKSLVRLETPKFGGKAGDVVVTNTAKLRGFDPYNAYSPVEVPLSYVAGKSPQAIASRIMGQISPALRRRFGLGADLGEVNTFGGPANARNIVRSLAEAHGHPMPAGAIGGTSTVPQGLSTSRVPTKILSNAGEDLAALYRLGLQ